MPKLVPMLLLGLMAGPAMGQSGAPAPQPLPRATFITTMDGEYRKLDTNKDNFLTPAEIEASQRAASAERARQAAQALFQRLDTDRNGSLSVAEFARVPVAPPRIADSPIMGFDANRDGKVSLVEHRTATLLNFDRLDVDKDGIVSAVEMQGVAGRR